MNEQRSLGEPGRRPRPRSRSRGVLVISVGLSPQVVTETVYALACERGEPIDEIYMWTTSGGASVIERTLIDGGRGALYRLFAEYGLRPPEVHTKVFGRAADAPAGLRLNADRPLEDIRTREDNELVADTLLSFIRDQAADPSRRLFCSLAGARKTIGPYLALALQFYGREGDRLFHVLVPPHLEADRDFFYPPPGSPPGLIELVEVPVALLREHLDVLNVPGSPSSYSELVRRVEEELSHLKEPPLLRIGNALEVFIGENHLRLPALARVVYVALAARRARCLPECPGCDRCFVPVAEVQDALLHQPLRRLVALGGFKDHRLETLSRWSSSESTMEDRLRALRETVSRINREIGDRPGRRAFRVARISWDGSSAYGIQLSPERIVVPAAVTSVWDS